MNKEQNYNKKKWKKILSRMTVEGGVRFIGLEVGLEVEI